jgi:carboxymethylenebutenolidase
VLVLHEAGGLLDFARDVCDRLAREGFVALAPDLHAGRSDADPEAAARLMMDLDAARAGCVLDAAVAELLNAECVEGARVGAVGFCMGGWLALLAAARNRRVGAAVSFYAAHPGVALELSQLEAPVLVISAERDEQLPAEAAAELESALGAAGKLAAVRVQPGVRRGFMNDSRPDVFDAVAAAEGWDTMLAFLRAELP